MNKTYNVFVDNGLFVASYYLDKKIEDITIGDLKDNIDLFTDKVNEFLNTEKFKKIIDMGFHNSCYTQKPKKVVNDINHYKELFDKYNVKYDQQKQELKLSNIRDSIFYTYNLMLDNLGDDEYCSICGEKHVKLNANAQYLSMLTNAIMPLLTSNTFFNHSNNLQLINVCPICTFLSMLSILNMRKAGYLILYNSEDNDFMYNMTSERQNEFRIDYELGNKSNNKNGNTIELQNEILNFMVEKYLYETSLEVYKLNNGGQSSAFERNFMSKKNLMLFKQVYEEGCIEEFTKLYLFNNLLKGNIGKVYLNKILDKANGKLKISNELFDILDGRLNDLDKKIMDLIKRIADGIDEINNKDSIKQLEGVSNYQQFEGLILKWQSLYKEKKGENLLTSQEEFNLIANVRKYHSIKNRILFELYLK